MWPAGHQLATPTLASYIAVVAVNHHPARCHRVSLMRQYVTSMSVKTVNITYSILPFFVIFDKNLKIVNYRFKFAGQIKWTAVNTVSLLLKKLTLCVVRNLFIIYLE